MRILIVGSGGREHALAWKLAQEAEVFCTPGNPGMAQVGECIPVPATDHWGLVELANSKEVDLVVIGPEDPLVAGLADVLRAAGLLVFGPNADGAQLEASKAFSKALMIEAKVNTARYKSFRDPKEAKDFAKALRSSGQDVVVKASGNAVGKGVIVCDNEDMANEAIEGMLVDRQFGEAGAEIVIEERLHGVEFSLLTLCSDGGIFSLPPAQDYKRIFTGDRGPNTGGMGSYSPLPHVSQEMVRQTELNAVRPILSKLKEKEIGFRGLLFSGLMVQSGRVYCLEYNVRFGDPETQSLMLRLGKGLAAALLACAKGEAIPDVEILDNAAVTVAVASAGYPGPVEKGIAIQLGEIPPDVQVFHAGTAVKDGGLVTNGGRVLAISAAAKTLEEARRNAYAAADLVAFQGAQYRSDIANL